MEINDLRIFKSLSLLESTSKTAQALNYVQSNISKRLAKLEEETRKKLFYRSNRGLQLTEDGEKFLPYVDSILKIYEEMERDFIHKNQLKPIRIGSSQTITKNYLEKYIFSPEYEIHTGNSKELLQKLKENRLDAVISNQVIDDSCFSREKVWEEKISFIKSKDNHQPFVNNYILVNRDMDCPYRKAVAHYLNENKIKDVKIIEVDTLDTLLSMLYKESTLSVLPEVILQGNIALEKQEFFNFDPVPIYLYHHKSEKIPLDKLPLHSFPVL